MLTFSWTGKRKKKSDASDHAHASQQSQSKFKSGSDYNSTEPSVSRSTTSTGSIHFGQVSSFTSMDTNFKEAEYSGRLYLAELRLSEFPVEAFVNNELLDIVFIDIRGNRLSTLPVDFALFDCLISCVASANRFRTIPTCICSLEQLTFLDFSANEIAHLPDGLFDLPLVTLLLADNKITTIPDAIRRLAPTLSYLDLSNNKLHHVELHLKYLKELKVLKLASNSILEFNAEFCTSLQLRTLDLAGNNMTSLPYNFQKMTDLRDVKLDSNPMKHPPLKVVERGIIHIFKWLDENTKTNGHNSEKKPDSDTNQNDFPNGSRKSPNLENTTKSAVLVPTRIQVHHQRAKDPIEKPSTLISTTNTKSQNVQIVNNNKQPTIVPTNNNGNSKIAKHTSNVDEQNNNQSRKSSATTVNKPVSKVAPIIKGSNLTQPRPLANNGNILQKPTTINKFASTMNISKLSETAKKAIPTTTKSKVPPSTLSRRSEEPVKSKPMARPAVKKPEPSIMISDVESARKLMREKLGPSFAMGKGDSSFSQQLADGSELCKFVNKVHPNSITIATTADSAISSTRARLNVDKFIQFCKKIGVPETTQCTTLDILTKKNPNKIARTVLSIYKLPSIS